jgi:hypothetical protein
VLSQDVVLIQTRTADGRSCAQTSIWAVQNVEVQPLRQSRRPLVRVLVGAGVGPCD